jgi:hypothetical protein
MFSTVSGQGPVASCCECGDKLSGSWATELVIIKRAFSYFSKAKYTTFRMHNVPPSLGLERFTTTSSDFRVIVPGLEKIHLFHPGPFAMRNPEAYHPVDIII